MADRGLALDLNTVCKSYDSDRYVLDQLDLSIQPGEMVSLLGPSGCGKSTALRIVGGLISPTSGVVRLDGKDITRHAAHDRNMGLVFQNYALFPHMTVAANVAFGLEMRGMSRREALRRAGAALERVRLERLGDRRPRQLSGGQQQRVALARALVIEPALLLLDEPLSNLDAKLREDMRIEIRELQRQSGVTSIFVTHDQAEALAISDRVAVLNGGRVEQYGSPEEIYEAPATPFVASFIGRVNTFRGRAALLAAESMRIDCGNGLLLDATGKIPDGPAVLMVRPNRISLKPAGTPAAPGRNRLDATLLSIVYAGDMVLISAEAMGHTVFIELPSRGANWHSLTPGAKLTLDWSAGDGFLFAEN